MRVLRREELEGLPVGERGFIAGNIGAGIFFVLLIVFVVWFLSASSPRERLKRVCRPVWWFGDLWVSVGELDGRPEVMGDLSYMRDKMDYSCQWIIWRLFYFNNDKNASRESGGDVNGGGGER